MFSISVETTFRAEHHIRLPDGSTEEPHAHHWGVRVILRRKGLDALEMVADFEHVLAELRRVVLPFENADLNTAPALAGRNPTAEVVAEYVFRRLDESGMAWLDRVEVTEAPGCIASYQHD